MTYFFTSDEHYGHAGILKYCDRPFDTIEEHDAELIRRHNLVVSKNDIVVHAGDFCWCNTYKDAQKYISNLNGNHIFIVGSHDHWLPNSAKYMWRKTIDGQFIVVCHYAMRVWERSHYNSWHLYGHSHGKLEPNFGKSVDIGVDCWGFRPVSFEEIKEYMKHAPDNFNLVKKEDTNERTEMLGTT